MSGRFSPWNHDFLFLQEHIPLETAIHRLLGDSSQKKAPVVFLYGTPGVGKSHFLHAFLQRCFLHSQPTQPQILSASTICELVTEAAKEKNSKTKLENFAKTDFLVCEDIQSFSQRFAAQRIFTRLLDRIVQTGGKIVLTANVTPGDIRHLSPRFSNRCRWGGVYRLDMPSEESRLKLASYFCQFKRLNIDDAGLKLLSGYSPGTPRTLLALFEQLEHHRKVKKIHSFSPLEIQKILDEYNHLSPKISLSKITKEISRHFDLSIAQIRSRHQNQHHVLPRQCAMYLARELTDKTLSSIGTYFGGRSHSTVIHAWKHIGRIRNRKQDLNGLLTQLQNSLMGIF